MPRESTTTYDQERQVAMEILYYHRQHEDVAKMVGITKTKIADALKRFLMREDLKLYFDILAANGGKFKIAKFRKKRHLFLAPPEQKPEESDPQVSLFDIPVTSPLPLPLEETRPFTKMIVIFRSDFDGILCPFMTRPPYFVECTTDHCGKWDANKKKCDRC